MEEENVSKKEKKEATGDNRKFRVRPQLLFLLDQLAERKATDVTELVNQAVRELLEREWLWPPPKPGDYQKGPGETNDSPPEKQKG
jgi:hypothetical protein